MINDLILAEEYFNNLTECELRRELNDIALPAGVQKKIQDDVKNLFDQ